MGCEVVFRSGRRESVSGQVGDRQLGEASAMFGRRRGRLGIEQAARFSRIDFAGRGTPAEAGAASSRHQAQGEGKPLLVVAARHRGCL